MKDFQQRVVEEKDQLIEKIGNLRDFMDTPKFRELPDAEQKRLVRQFAFMSAYYWVLDERIAEFN